MPNTPTTSMRLDPEVKDAALKILEPLGLNLTSAVTVFLKTVVREQGLPFPMKMNVSERTVHVRLDK